jgi:hypothetical protein
MAAGAAGFRYLICDVLALEDEMPLGLLKWRVEDWVCDDDFAFDLAHGHPFGMRSEP